MAMLGRKMIKNQQERDGVVEDAAPAKRTIALSEQELNEIEDTDIMVNLKNRIAVVGQHLLSFFHSVQPRRGLVSLTGYGQGPEGLKQGSIATFFKREDIRFVTPEQAENIPALEDDLDVDDLEGEAKLGNDVGPLHRCDLVSDPDPDDLVDEERRVRVRAGQARIKIIALYDLQKKKRRDSRRKLSTKNKVTQAYEDSLARKAATTKDKDSVIASLNNAVPFLASAVAASNAERPVPADAELVEPLPDKRPVAADAALVEPVTDVLPDIEFPTEHQPDVQAPVPPPRGADDDAWATFREETDVYLAAHEVEAPQELEAEVSKAIHASFLATSAVRRSSDGKELADKIRRDNVITEEDTEPKTPEEPYVGKQVINFRPSVDDASDAEFMHLPMDELRHAHWRFLVAPCQLERDRIRMYKRNNKWVCTECAFNPVSNWRALERHMMRHSPWRKILDEVLSNGFECPVDGQIFANQEEVVEHLLNDCADCEKYVELEHAYQRVFVKHNKNPDNHHGQSVPHVKTDTAPNVASSSKLRSSVKGKGKQTAPGEATPANDTAAQDEVTLMSEMSMDLIVESGVETGVDISSGAQESIRQWQSRLAVLPVGQRLHDDPVGRAEWASLGGFAEGDDEDSVDSNHSGES
ncbi:hypothetical protein OF83DRAFT_488587 [Amylostereum chailletii]|nr:hypothetical protein OF83DRAFT_488587 [Amylostereum chailletii]